MMLLEEIACDIVYRKTNVLRLSAQYLSEREITVDSRSLNLLDNSDRTSCERVIAIS